jgi:hypothetical protein
MKTENALTDTISPHTCLKASGSETITNSRVGLVMGFFAASVGCGTRDSAAARMLQLVLTSSILASCAEGSAARPGQPPSPYREQVLADQPVGYWRLDEASGHVAFDQSTNHNDGVIAKGVTTGYPGAIPTDMDAAMFFDGISAEVSVPSSASLEIAGGSVTLEAWVKYIGLQGTQVTIIGKGTAGVQTEYGLVLVDGVPGYQSVVERYLASSGSLVPGVWTHVAVTVAANEVGTFYVNGVGAGTFPASNGHVVTRAHQPVTIANEAGIPSRFVGGIDDAAIYAYALTAQQISRHVALAWQKARSTS